MIKTISNIVFYGKNKKKAEKKAEKELDKNDSIVENALYFIKVAVLLFLKFIFSTKTFFVESYYEIKHNKKNAVENNLTLAKKFLQGGHISDGLMRIKLALLFDKNNFNALLMFAYFYYENENYKKSLKYFNKIKQIKGEQTPPEINFMINELNLIIKK